MLVHVVIAVLSLAAAPKKALIVVYDGYGTRSSFTAGGRVFEDKGARAPSTVASGADNLFESVKTLEADEVRGVEVSVTVGARVFTATTDDDGEFHVEAKGLAAAEQLARGPQAMHVALLPSAGTAPHRDGERYEAEPKDGVVYVSDDDSPAVGLISDVDDTIVKTYVTDKGKMIGAVSLLLWFGVAWGGRWIGFGG